MIVTHGFLKRLARLELEESAIGRFAEEHARGAAQPEDVTIGSTPWAVVAALAAAFAALVAAVLALAAAAPGYPDLRLRRPGQRPQLRAVVAGVDPPDGP